MTRMKEQSIPFGRPNLDQAEMEAVTKVLSGTQFVHGEMTKAFEEAFAKRIGVKHAIALSSCTAGLHLSLHVQSLEKGARVAVPAMTHVATAHAVEYCGGTPVFVDVDPATGNIDPDGLQAAAQDGLKAIMVVHYLGLPCDFDRILPVARKAGAMIVEDCALAVDATYGGRKVGGVGAVGCFSFYPVKHMTTIEGGMATTNDDGLAGKIRQQRSFGYSHDLHERRVPGVYDVTKLGYNYRMNEVEAAVGLVQLGKLDEFQRRRAMNDAALRTAVAEIDEITVFPASLGKARSSHYCFNVVLPRDGSIDRASTVPALHAAGIGTSLHYPSAVPLFTYYRERYGYRPGQFPVAEWLARQTISLPIGPHANVDDMQHIGVTLKSAIATARRAS